MNSPGSFLRHTLVRYILTGILNTFFGLGIIYLLKWAMAFSDISANLCGYLLGFIMSFFLNKKWTFKFQGTSHRTFLKFSLLVVMAYATNLAFVVLAVDHWNFGGYMAQAVGIFPYTAINYFGSKYWVFRECKQGICTFESP